MEMKIGIIIQARLGSTRFERKVLEKIGGKELLLFLYDRLKNIKRASQIVLATSTERKDDILVNFSKKIGLPSFRGSLDDVLLRFYLCAKDRNFDVIIRVTADDPFKDPVVINKALDIFINNKFDYVSNTISPTYPEGIDVEVFSFNALEKAQLSSALKSERMHVTPYIWSNPEIFALHNFKDIEDNSSYRFTCDYIEDLDYLNKLYSHTMNDDFSYLDIINIAKKHGIKNMRNTIRNEGYIADSVKENKNE